MVRRYNRLLVALYVLSDALMAMWALVLAYGIRFESGLIPVTQGYPPFEQYVNVLPFIAVLTPAAFQLQGVYRLRRGRSRIDDFFAVLIGSILAVVLGVISTLYVQAYYASEAAKARGAYEVSQLVWALFLGLNVLLTYASREGVRELLERRWRAGIGLKRILIAGVGDLGRMVADRILQHRELGYQVIGFVDDRAGGDHIGYRGLPLLGTLAEVGDIAQRERIDHLYVALPLEEHSKLLDLIELTSRECLDVKVVPDLLQFIALRARLENLDGVPIISLNDVPLRGFNSVLKRAIDFSLSGASLLVMAIYRRLAWRTIKLALFDTVKISSMIFLIIISSVAFSQILAYTGTSGQLVSFATGSGLPPWGILVGMLVTAILLGTFLDELALLMISIPIYMPLVKALAFDPLWFGLLMLLTLEIATISPPYGLALFVLKGVVPDASMVDVWKASIAYMIISTLVLAIILIFPGLATFLPGLMR